MKLLWWWHGRVGAERKEGRKILLELKEREEKRREERETKQKVRYGFGPMDLEG